jgi:hypothetical protein
MEEKMANIQTTKKEARTVRAIKLNTEIMQFARDPFAVRKARRNWCRLEDRHPLIFWRWLSQAFPSGKDIWELPLRLVEEHELNSEEVPDVICIENERSR